MSSSFVVWSIWAGIKKWNMYPTFVFQKFILAGPVLILARARFSSKLIGPALFYKLILKNPEFYNPGAYYYATRFWTHRIWYFCPSYQVRVVRLYALHFHLCSCSSSGGSTANSRSRWALLDFNGKLQISIGTAGLQRQTLERRGRCETLTPPDLDLLYANSRPVGVARCSFQTQHHSGLQRRPYTQTPDLNGRCPAGGHSRYRRPRPQTKCQKISK